jgi:hypothetical protein
MVGKYYTVRSFVIRSLRHTLLGRPDGGGSDGRRRDERTCRSPAAIVAQLKKHEI